MTTLLLSGWAQPVDALAHLSAGAAWFDYSAYATPEEAMRALEKMNPAYVIGWSLGGQLALRALAAGAMAPRHLTLIAAPHCFVGAGGMGAETFRLFRDSYANDPSRTKTRFHGLVAKGDREAKRVMGALGHHPQVEQVARWLPWLDALAEYQTDAGRLASAPPTLIIHGMNDAIVPMAQSEALARALPQAKLNLWEGAGHAPHLHDAARLRAEIAAHRALHAVA